MARKQQFVYGKYDSGQDFLALVKPPVADVRRNGGSHAVVTVRQGEYSGETMCIPDHDLGVGLSCKIWKWFVKVGLILMMVAMLGYAIITFC